jgi:hypothetical protein
MDPVPEANPNGKRTQFSAQNQLPTAIDMAKLPFSVALAIAPATYQILGD